MTYYKAEIKVTLFVTLDGSHAKMILLDVYRSKEFVVYNITH